MPCRVNEFGAPTPVAVVVIVAGAVAVVVAGVVGVVVAGVVIGIFSQYGTIPLTLMRISDSFGSNNCGILHLFLTPSSTCAVTA